MSTLISFRCLRAGDFYFCLRHLFLPIFSLFYHLAPILFDNGSDVDSPTVPLFYVVMRVMGI